MELHESRHKYYTSAPCSLSFLLVLWVITKHRTQFNCHRNGRELYIHLIKSFDENLIIWFETLNVISTHNIFNGDGLHLKHDSVMLCYSMSVWKWGSPLGSLVYNHNYGNLFSTSIITNDCTVFQALIWASSSLTHSPQLSGPGPQCSDSRISLTSLELLVHGPNHRPLRTSFPSLPGLDSKSIIIITSFHKLSTLLLLLILSWRSLNSQIHPILSLQWSSWKSLKEKKEEKKKSITMMTGLTFNFWPQTLGGSSAQPGNAIIPWSSHSPGGPLHIFPILTLTLSLALFHSEENLFLVQKLRSKVLLLPPYTTGPFSSRHSASQIMCAEGPGPAPVPQSSVNLYFCKIQ